MLTSEPLLVYLNRLQIRFGQGEKAIPYGLFYYFKEKSGNELIRRINLFSPFVVDPHKVVAYEGARPDNKIELLL